MSSKNVYMTESDSDSDSDSATKNVHMTKSNSDSDSDSDSETLQELRKKYPEVWVLKHWDTDSYRSPHFNPHNIRYYLKDERYFSSYEKAEECRRRQYVHHNYYEIDPADTSTMDYYDFMSIDD